MITIFILKETFEKIKTIFKEVKTTFIKIKLICGEVKHSGCEEKIKFTFGDENLTFEDFGLSLL